MLDQNWQQIIDEFDYSFPPEAIAQKPAHPRDEAKLLVFNRATKEVTFTTFKEIGKYLPPQSVLVLNDTKVLPARLTVQTPTGKSAQLLYLRTAGDVVIVLSNKKLEPQTVLTAQDTQLFTVLAQNEKEYSLSPLFPLGSLPEILEKFGTTPLPPYIKESPLSEEERRAEYQTVFAKEPGSIAAPTASLHFTPELLQNLEASGITLHYLTLHVNLGTFAPLSEANFIAGRLHTEYYDISSETARSLQQAKQADRPIIAVGSTATRALEAATQFDGTVRAGAGHTDLFIRPGYEFKTVNGLITNFHVPRSSLLMLVSALTGREQLLDLYKQALDHQFKFFSFGDSMLIL